MLQFFLTMNNLYYLRNGARESDFGPQGIRRAMLHFIAKNRFFRHFGFGAHLEFLSKTPKRFNFSETV